MKRWGKRRLLAAAAAGLMLALLLFRAWGERPLSVFAPVARLGETLILDAGHGGEDGGAVSSGGTVESGINLAITLKMDAIAGLFGVPTLMIRTDDRSIHDTDAQSLRERKRSDLKNRVALVEQAGPATLISIHQNIYTSAKYHGAQVFYADEETGRPLAEYAQQMLRDFVDPDNTRRAAQISADVYLMQHITCRAILVECGFLSNPEEERRLLDSGYQCKLAAVLLSAYLSFEPQE